MNNNVNSTISMGLINFVNCIPINYSLYKWGHEKLILSDGYPTLLNQLMLDNQLHVAFVSSIEYLKNMDKYTLIEEPCISSDGEVGSVILFSNCDFEDLEEKVVGIPYTSSSSNTLLKVLLDQYGYDLGRIEFVTHKYESSLESMLNGKFDAVLYIGDPALTGNIKYKDKFKCYDLGKMWKDLTDCPMTFGTWVARTDWKINNEDDYNWVSFILNKAVEAGLNMYFNDIVEIAQRKLEIDRIHVEDYLTRKINYSFTNKHREGLELFKNMYDNLNMQAEKFLKV